MQRKIFLMLAVLLSAMVFSGTASAQQKFSVSLNSQQEVPVRPSSGIGSCQITLATGEAQISVTCTYTGTTSNVVGAHIHDAGPVGVNGPIRFNFNYTGGTSGTIGPLTFPTTAAQIADLRAGRWYVNIHTSNFTGGEIRGQVKLSSLSSDHDGDGRADFRVLRSTANGFFILNSLTSSITFNSFAGASSSSSISDDFDGDGRADLLMFFAEGTTRVWRILQTATNTVREVRWGSTAATDQVLPADYDGDGKTDIAVFRRNEGIWYIIQSSNGQTRAEVYGIGGTSDIGVVGDFDKDGRNDLTVFRNGTTASAIPWFSRRSSDGQTQTVLWGGAAAPAGDSVFTAAQVDIDGDGAQDHMVVRDSNGTTTGGTFTFIIRRSSDGQTVSIPWGFDSDLVRLGDYDGDGKTDIGARRTENGLFVWYIFQSSTQSGRAVTFGGTGDARPGEPEEVLEENEMISVF